MQSTSKTFLSESSVMSVCDSPHMRMSLFPLSLTSTLSAHSMSPSEVRSRRLMSKKRRCRRWPGSARSDQLDLDGKSTQFVLSTR